MKLIEQLTPFLCCMFRYPRPTPKSVQIDITTVCNFKCKMCPIHFVKQESKHIDFEVFTRIVDKLEGVEEVSLVGLGEPFANPELLDAVRYCKDKGMTVKTTSNGVLLNTDEKLKDIIDSGLDVISFSVDNLTRKGGIAEGHPEGAGVRNIERLIELRNELGSVTPKVVIQSVYQKEMEEDMIEVIRWADRIGAHRMNVLRMHMYFDTGVDRPDMDEEKVFYKRLAGLRKELDVRIDCIQDQFFTGFKGFLYKYILKYFLRLDDYCVRLLDYPFVNQEGELIPCCALPEHTFGNILDSSLDEVWHGEKLNKFRKMHNSVKICSKCDNWRIKQII